VIVIDASALVAHLLGEKNFEKYFYEELCSINLLIKESTNALIIAFRRGRINENSLQICFKALKKLSNIIEFESQAKILDDAFVIALEENLTIYDALYVALAKKLNAKLLSLDKKQRKVAEGKEIQIIP